MKTFLLILFSCLALAVYSQSFSRTPAFIGAARPQELVTETYNPFVFDGNELFAPGYTSTSLTDGLLQITTTKIIVDCKTHAGSAYASFGVKQANCIMDAQISEDSGYTPLDLQAHAGIVTRICDTNYASDQDFAGMALINVASNQFEVIDRVGGVEVYTIVTNITPALDYGVKYWIHFDNSSGDIWTASLSNETCSVRLAVTNGTFSADVPATGWQGLHTYGSIMSVYKCSVKVGESSLVTGTSRYLRGVKGDTSASVYVYGGCAVTNGCLTLYTDGSYHSYDGWNYVTSAASNLNCSMTGYIGYKSGTFGGPLVYLTSTGTGYMYLYRNNDTLNLYTYNNAGAGDLLASDSCTLTANTLYPFTLTVSNVSGPSTVLSMTLNGVTVSNTNSTYTAGGKVGLIGYKSQMLYSNIVVNGL